MAEVGDQEPRFFGHRARREVSRRHRDVIFFVWHLLGDDLPRLKATLDETMPAHAGATEMAVDGRWLGVPDVYPMRNVLYTLGVRGEGLEPFVPAGDPGRTGMPNRFAAVHDEPPL